MEVIAYTLSMNFKFQSDSINTHIEIPLSMWEAFFKFQSDSINTHVSLSDSCIVYTLNSNLILLILKQRSAQRSALFALNSNLILLIRPMAARQHRREIL